MDQDHGVISVIIPNYNGAKFLTPCLTSLMAQDRTGFGLEVLLIDNGSTDESASLTREQFPDVRVIECGENTGFTCAVNRGAVESRGEWLLLLNNDTVMQPGSLQLLCEVTAHSEADVAAVQPLLVCSGDEQVIDSAGIALKAHVTAHDDLHGAPIARAPQSVTETFGVCFACALVNRQAFERIGGLDPDFFAEWDDVDFALRGRWHGYRFLLEPRARVLHHRSPTQAQMPEARFIRYRRNRLLTYAKSLPAGMAIDQWFYRAQKDVFALPHHVRRGQVRNVLRSWREAALLLPMILRRRRELKGSASLTASELRRMIRTFTRPTS